MHRLSAVILALMLLVLPAAVFSAPGATQASPAAYQRTLNGVLVASPQHPISSQYAQLFLQVGGRTVLVSTNLQTAYTDRANNPVSLTDLRDRAQLRVTGDYNGGQIIASMIQDLSLAPAPSFQVNGRIANPSFQSSSILCVSGAHLALAHRAQARLQLSTICGRNLALYLSGSTRVQDRNGRTISIGDLRSGNTLVITATLNGGQVVALVIKDTSIDTNISTLTGTLVATPQIINAANAQLLIQVDSRTILVQVNSGTQFVNDADGSIGLADLKDGDQLRVIGSYNGVQILATSIKDLSLQVVATFKVAGQVASPLAGQPTGPICVSGAQIANYQPSLIRTQVVNLCGSNLSLYLNGSTTIVDQFGHAVALSALQVGDSLKATATLSAGQFTASTIQDVSLPTSGILQVTGQIVAPLPAVGQSSGPICLSGSQITGYLQPQIRALVVGPCGSNLALYLAGNAAIQNNGGQAIPLAALRAGDNLTATATLISGQFTATLVQDHAL